MHIEDERIDLLCKIMSEDWNWMIDEDEAEIMIEAVEKANRLIKLRVEDKQ